MLAVELTTLARRPRTWLLAALSPLLPALFLAGMTHSPSPPHQAGDPVAYLAAAQHGWALVAAPLLLGSPIFLPIVVAFIGGTSIGADAASGHLRYLLTRPVSRHRLYLTKLTATSASCLALTAMLVVLGILAAVALPRTGGLHPLALRPDRTVAALGAAGFLARTAAAVCYLTLWLAALAALALLAGLLTGSATTGVGLAVGYHLAATVLTQISALRPLHPALLPYWLGRWTSLAQTRPHWATLATGAACSIAYLTISTLIGLAILARKDITS